MVPAETHTGVVMVNQPESWQFQSLSFILFPGGNEHVHSLHKQNLGSLQPSCKSHWFSNQPRGLVFPLSNPRVGVPNMLFKPLTPQGGTLGHDIPLLFCVLSYRGMSQLDHFPSYPFTCESFFTALVVEESFCQPPVCFQ